MNDILKECRLCPRECGINRFERKGFCGEGANVRIARAEPHHWEEPPISGEGGAGTVFFSGCTLRCCYCQNYEISSLGKGFELTVSELYESFERLIKMGCENIELVSSTQFVPQIIKALEMFAGDRPTVVYNTGGYEKADTLRMLEGYVDVYLPDIKYYDSAISAEYSSAENYFEVTINALKEMLRQVGRPVFDDNGIMRKGIIVRHLVLPSHRKDSLRLIDELSKIFSPEDILISLMSQYTPVYKAFEHKELSRKTSTFEYESVLKAVEAAGFDGYFQEKSSADKDFIPEFFDKKYY
ncbi:MAG: radical SAM protein [Ruminococcus sp.]|nr:radical SAM protein [Ruminococcus sp.]